MKRMLCGILAFAMLLSFLPPISLQASAAEMVEQIRIEVGSIRPGQQIPEEPDIRVISGGTLLEAHWGEEWEEEPPEETTFLEEKEYVFSLQVQAPEGAGYESGYTDVIAEGDQHGMSWGFSDNVLHLTVYITARWPYLDSARLVGLPSGIGAGTAQVPQVTNPDGEVEILGVSWVDANKKPVTAFQSGKLYYLAVEMKPLGEYRFGRYFEPYPGGEAYNVFVEETVLDGNLKATAYLRYSMLPVIRQVSMTVEPLQVGMTPAEIAAGAAVQEGATLKEVQVFNYTTGEELTQEPLEEAQTYQVVYVLEPLAGQEFNSRQTELLVNGDPVDANVEPIYIEYQSWFSSYEAIDMVELTMSQVEPGTNREDVTVTAPAGAPYRVIEWFFENEMGEEWDTFESGSNYRLSVELQPEEGYCFSQGLDCRINGLFADFGCDVEGQYGYAHQDLEFGVNYIWLGDLPQEIEPGAAQVWEPVCNEQVKVIGTQWVDADKQPVTVLEDGKVYYLATTLEAQGTRCFGLEPEISADCPGQISFQALTEKTAVVYISYSLEPLAGDLDIVVTGLGEGKPVAGVTATVNGNAVLSQMVIYKYIYDERADYYDYEEVTDGNFEPNSTYWLAFALTVKEGYRFGGDFRVFINGRVTDSYGYGSTEMEASGYFTTCQEITKATLTLPKVAVGKSFADLKVTAPKNANYTVSTQWYDTETWETVSGKVLKGHKYELYVLLTPKAGYALSQDLEVTLNGEDFSVYTEAIGDSARGYKTYSFCEKITKVELPAMPESIRKGQTLPTMSVASGKNYTLESYWGIMDGDDADTVEEDGVYLLVYTARPKSGYEFTQDTVFYIGGKQAYPIEMGDSGAQFVRNYNVGVREITKVELQFREPEGGQPVPEVTIPATAEYKLAGAAWAQSASDNLYSPEDVTEVLTQGMYTYFYVMLEAAGDKALASDGDFYLNGKKTEPLMNACFGTYSIVVFSLGKLGEIEKLTAPALTATGTELCWNGVTNATGYEIYRATSKSGKYTLVDTVEDTQWTDQVTPGKTYYYKVKAVYDVDPEKNSGFSAVVSVAYKLAAPTITVENGATGKPVISWEKVDGAKKYTVYRATSETGKYTKLGTASKLTYTDSKAKAGTEYFYKVIANASSAAYNSGESQILSCYVICGTPTVTVQIDAATGKPALSWKKVDGAVGYRILRQLPGEEAFTVLKEQTALTFGDTTAPIDTVCRYQVQAMGSEAQLDGACSETVTATSGIARPALQASVDSISGKPVFTWQPVEGAVTYELYRSTKSTKGFSLIDTLDSNAYVDDTVAAGKTYYYKLVAVGAVSRSAETGAVKLTGKCAVPTITVENGDSGKPVISWEKIDGAKNYTVYRATSETGKYTKLGTASKLTYTDSKAKAGTEYFYKIIANASSSKNNSGYSNVVSCNVICGRPTVTVKIDAATGKPALSWKKVDGAVGYRILRQLPGEEAFTVLKEQTTLTFTDTTAPIDTCCVYAVQAVGKSDVLDGMLSAAVEAVSGIARPQLNGGINSAGQPRFDWQPVEGAVAYEIYRSTKATKGYSLIHTLDDGNAYADPNTTPGKTYYYKIVAVGAVSRSAESAYVKLTGKCAAPEVQVRTGENGLPTLTWQKVNGAKQYTVYRSAEKFGSYKKLGTTKTLTFIDTTAKVGEIYFYQVVANASSSKYNSGYSYPMGAMTVCAAPTVGVSTDPATGKPMLTWGKVSGAVAYQVYLLGGEDYVTLATVEGCLFVDENCVPGDLRYYGVRAIGAFEEYNSAVSQPVSARGKLPTPQLTGLLSADGKPAAYWTEVEGAEKYIVYRATGATGTYTEIDQVYDAFFIDDTAKKGKTYYYKVVAVGEEAESELSGYVKLKSK